MVLALLGALLVGTVSAQIYIPPVFGKDSLDTRPDELSRLYIPPKRIMWVSHDSLVQNKEVLLLSGNGQPELGKVNATADLKTHIPSRLALTTNSFISSMC